MFTQALVHQLMSLLLKRDEYKHRARKIENFIQVISIRAFYIVQRTKNKLYSPKATLCWLALDHGPPALVPLMGRPAHLGCPNSA